MKENILLTIDKMYNSEQNSSGDHAYESLLKMLNKWSVDSIAPGSVRLVPYFIVTRVKLGQKSSIAAISQIELLSPNSPVLTLFKTVYVVL